MEFPQRRGPWQVLARKTVYQDPWIQVDRDQVIRPDGAAGTHCIVHLLPGISVLPVDEAGMAYLTEDFHYGVGRTTIEVVSGGIEPGEDPRAAAERELREELGISAGEWIDLGTCDPFTTIVVSPTRLFLAQRLSFGANELEGTEKTRVVARAAGRRGADGLRQPNPPRAKLRADSQGPRTPGPTGWPGSLSRAVRQLFQCTSSPLRSARLARCAAAAALTPASAGAVGLLPAANALDPVGQVQRLAVRACRKSRPRAGPLPSTISLALIFLLRSGWISYRPRSRYSVASVPMNSSIAPLRALTNVPSK